MTILATIAMIVLIVVGIMVLRLKSDPMEKASVRKILADHPPPPEAASPIAVTKPTDLAPPSEPKP
jgi:hypothetical protein